MFDTELRSEVRSRASACHGRAVDPELCPELCDPNDFEGFAFELRLLLELAPTSHAHDRHSVGEFSIGDSVWNKFLTSRSLA